MITRVWHGRTRPEHADEYLAFLQDKGTRDYLRTPGNRSARIWRKQEADSCHFWTVTEWDDVDSIRSFAGEALEKARYYPEDQGMLLEFEERVSHYECTDVSDTKCRDFIRQLKQLYDGGSWQGESLSEKLADIDEVTAFTQPLPGVHCIAEIVWHCIYWRTVGIKRLQGDVRYRDETVSDLNFLSVKDLWQKGWAAVKDELAQSQALLIRLVRANKDSFLTNEYQAGCTYAFQLE